MELCVILLPTLVMFNDSPRNLVDNSRQLEKQRERERELLSVYKKASSVCEKSREKKKGKVVSSFVLEDFL